MAHLSFFCDGSLHEFDIVLLLVLGHALYENNSREQKGIRPLVSSQERKALIIWLINRSSTGRKPLVVFLDPVYTGLDTYVASEETSRTVFVVPCWARSHTAIPFRPAALRRAPLCPARAARLADVCRSPRAYVALWAYSSYYFASRFVLICWSLHLSLIIIRHPRSRIHTGSGKWRLMLDTFKLPHMPCMKRVYKEK